MQGAPALGADHLAQLTAELTDAIQLKGFPISGRRVEERQQPPLAVALAVKLLIGCTGGQGDDGDDLDLGRVTTGALRPRAQTGQADLLEVARVRVRRVGDDSSGQLTGQPAHRRADGTEPRRGSDRLSVGPGIEVWLQPGDRVVAVRDRLQLTAAEGVVHRMQRSYERAHACDRRRPGHCHPVFDVLPDLRSETELETSLGERRQIPRRISGQRRATGEGEGDGGTDGQPLGVLRDEQRDSQRIVDGLGHADAVVPDRLDPPRVGRHSGQGHPRVHARIGLHRLVEQLLHLDAHVAVVRLGRHVAFGALPRCADGNDDITRGIGLRLHDDEDLR